MMIHFGPFIATRAVATAVATVAPAVAPAAGTIATVASSGLAIYKGSSFITERLRKKITPKRGSIVYVDLLGFFEHSGIYIDDNTIIEVNSDNSIKSVSFDEFTEGFHTGLLVYCAVDKDNNPICSDEWARKALSHVGKTNYSAFIPNNEKGQRNCHNFVMSCIVDNFIQNKCWTFGALKTHLKSQGFHHWQPCWDKLSFKNYQTITT